METYSLAHLTKLWLGLQEYCYAHYLQQSVWLKFLQVEFIFPFNLDYSNKTNLKASQQLNNTISIYASIFVNPHQEYTWSVHQS